MEKYNFQPGSQLHYQIYLEAVASENASLVALGNGTVVCHLVQSVADRNLDGATVNKDCFRS